jgi:alpha-L-fucosidase
MQRRDFLNSIGLLLGVIPFHLFKNFSFAGNTVELAVPLLKQLKWKEAELGMIFHFDISLFGSEWKSNNNYRGGYDPSIYNPKKLDTDQWIRIAKEAGCRYAVLTGTHFQGFMNWQSDAYPYGMKQVPWKNGKGDLLKEFVASCHKYGLKPGVYMSTHRNFYFNSTLLK